MSSVESSSAMSYFGPEPEAGSIKPYAGLDYVSYQPKVTLQEQLSYIKLPAFFLSCRRVNKQWYAATKDDRLMGSVLLKYLDQNGKYFGPEDYSKHMRLNITINVPQNLLPALGNICESLFKPSTLYPGKRLIDVIVLIYTPDTIIDPLATKKDATAKTSIDTLDTEDAMAIDAPEVEEVAAKTRPFCLNALKSHVQTLDTARTKTPEHKNAQGEAIEFNIANREWWKQAQAQLGNLPNTASGWGILTTEPVSGTEDWHLNHSKKEALVIKNSEGQFRPAGILNVATAIYGIFLKYNTLLLSKESVQCPEQIKAPWGSSVQSAIGSSSVGGPRVAFDSHGPYGVLGLQKIC